MPIKIIAKKAGFRRAGTAHHGMAIYADDHFTEDQLAALKAEPNLDVSEVAEMPEPKTDPGKELKSKK